MPDTVSVTFPTACGVRVLDFTSVHLGYTWVASLIVSLYIVPTTPSLNVCAV